VNLHFPSPPPASCLHKIFTVYHISCGPATRRLKTILGLIESHAKGVLLAPILSLSAAEIPWMHDHLYEWGHGPSRGFKSAASIPKSQPYHINLHCRWALFRPAGGQSVERCKPAMLVQANGACFHVAVKTRAPNISIG